MASYFGDLKMTPEQLAADLKQQIEKQYQQWTTSKPGYAVNFFGIKVLGKMPTGMEELYRLAQNDDGKNPSAFSSQVAAICEQHINSGSSEPEVKAFYEKLKNDASVGMPQVVIVAGPTTIA